MLDDLDDLSLEELLELRESILEQKKNLTYYIEESDDEDEDEDIDDGEYNEATEEKDDQVSEEVTTTHQKGEILDGEIGARFVKTPEVFGEG